MKRIILLLLTVLFLCCFVGCRKAPENNDGVKEDEKEDKYDGAQELEKDNELVKVLEEFLRNALTNYDRMPKTLEEKMDDIKNGDSAYIVDYRESSVYYVCAYSESDHEEPYGPYCCIDGYVWVKYDNIEDVREIYKDKKIAASFQMNIAPLVRDIISGEEGTVNIENFTQFYPKFENGALVNEEDTFEDIYVYIENIREIRESDSNDIYHSRFLYYNHICTIPCEIFDDKYYVTHHLYRISPDGESNMDEEYENLKNYYFGKYYDVLISVIDTETYRITYKSGAVEVYGIVEIGDFVNCIGNG